MNKKKLTEYKHRRRSKEKIPGLELHKEKSRAAWEQAKRALAGAGKPWLPDRTAPIVALDQGVAHLRAKLWFRGEQ